MLLACGPRVLTFFLYLSDVEEGTSAFTLCVLIITLLLKRSLIWLSEYPWNGHSTKIRYATVLNFFSPSILIFHRCQWLLQQPLSLTLSLSLHFNPSSPFSVLHVFSILQEEKLTFPIWILQWRQKRGEPYCGLAHSITIRKRYACIKINRNGWCVW